MIFVNLRNLKNYGDHPKERFADVGKLFDGANKGV